MRKRKGYKVAIWVAILLFAILLQVAARFWEGFGEFYAVQVYPLFVGTLGRAVSVFPFSLGEAGVYLVLLLFLVSLFVYPIRSVKKAGEKKKMKAFWSGLGRWIWCWGRMAIVLFLVFTLTCGINYYRQTFTQAAGIETDTYTLSDLEAACSLVIAQVNAAVKGVSFDEFGNSIMPDNTTEAVVKAMENLGSIYSSLSGYYPSPKPVTLSFVLSYQNIVGIYSPFTVEANYNRDIPSREIPSTMCHELSHLKGFMREAEANYIAYRACVESDSAYLQYSGAMLAYVYCMNAYYEEVDLETYREMAGQLDEQAQKESGLISVWWDTYQTEMGKKISQVSDQVNDTYLKANGQEEGSKSYGRMVDLIIAVNKEAGTLQ